MKLKRIEIQAFKTYVGRDDGVFDFTIGGSVANLVSIYAPNGFGKTSFYDAVDFCFTKNVTRYIRRTRLANRNKDQVKGLNENILRSVNAPADLKTMVRILTEEGQEFSQDLPNGQYQFNDKKTLPEKRCYRDLILAQESIDAFLREGTPEDRYTKFIETQSGEFSKLELKRSSIYTMLQHADKELGDYTEKIDVHTKALQANEYDSSVLSSFNDIALKLPSEYEVSLIDSEFSEEMNQILLVKVTQCLHSVALEDEKIKNARLSIYDHLKKINIYENSYKEREKVKERIIVLREAKNNYDQIEKLEGALAQAKLGLETDKVEESRLANLKKIFPVYRSAKELIEARRFEKTNLEKEIYQIRADIESNLTIREGFNIEIKKAVILIKSDKDFAARVPDLFREKSEILKDIKSLEDNISGLTANQEVLQNGLVHNRKQLNLIKTATLVWSSDELKTIFSGNSIAAILDSIYIAEEAVSKLKKVIEVSENEIKMLSDQNSSITDLLSLGTKIVEKNKSNKCPLCEADYNSFEVLLERIGQNAGLSSAEQVLISKLQVQQRDLSIAQDNVKNSIQAFVLYRDQEVAALASSLEETEGQLKGVVSQTGDYSEKISKLILKLAEIDSVIDQRTEEDLLKIFTEQALENEKKLDDYKRELLQTNSKIDLSKSALDKLDSRFEVLKSRLAEPNLNAEYNLVQEFFSSAMINLPNTIDGLEAMLAEEFNKISSKIELHQSNILKTRSDIAEISEKTSFISYEQILEELELLSASFTKFNGELLLFEKMVEQFSEIDLKDTSDWTAIRLRFDSEITAYDQKIERINSIKSDLELLPKLAERILVYLDQLNLTDVIEDLKNKVEALIPVVKTLSDDMKEVNLLLEKEINQYFYTDLINQIYSKVDPHPEFKSISFEYGNKGRGKPRLNIFTQNKDGGAKVSPTIHFSSAQINVLSFSIFLAKALHAVDENGKTINCIFIDDPIQSMDAINVLGVIDLLRNLITNLGKQIVVSTHDENFHELLKKKIPPNVYRSKYLELESFGKVGPHEGQSPLGGINLQ